MILYLLRGEILHFIVQIVRAVIYYRVVFFSIRFIE